MAAHKTQMITKVYQSLCCDFMLIKVNVHVSLVSLGLFENIQWSHVGNVGTEKSTANIFIPTRAFKVRCSIQSSLNVYSTIRILLQWCQLSVV